MISALIPALSGIIGKVIDRAIPDKAEADRIKSEVTMAMLQESRAELEGAVSIIKAEASGESWLQRTWRPILMLWFAGLVGAHWLGFTPPNLPEAVVLNLLDIVQVGVGGYIFARSADKGIKNWQSEKTEQEKIRAGRLK